MKQLHKGTHVPGADGPPLRTDWDRTLSWSDKQVFDLCELQYAKRKRRERKAPREIHQIIGDLTHDGVAEADLETREAELKVKLDRLPEETRVEAERIVRELIANDEELDHGDVTDQQKDRVLLRCKAPVEGWELVAKPDETGFVDGGKGKPVLQLIEKKTAYTLRKKHKEQLFFAGMVARVGQVLSYDGPIKLVIRLLRSKDERVFWYSRSATDRNMFRIKAVINRIEEALANDDFKARTGDHCKGCPYRLNCEAYAATNPAELKAAERRPAVAVVAPGGKSAVIEFLERRAGIVTGDDKVARTA